MEVVLEKQGKRERPDIGHLEHVAMGLKMQPTIARIFEDEHGVVLKELDISGTHAKHEWLRSHFDFVTADGTALVETKNYNDAVINKYSEPGDSVRVPAGDYYQCLHEAVVYGVSTVYLAVLFGGQRFRSFKLDFTEEEKESLIQRLANVWAHVVVGTLPEPQSPEEVKIAFPVSQERVVIANAEYERLAVQLARVKAHIKELEAQEETATAALQKAMGTAEEMQTVDGRTLATWRSSKPRKGFATDLFKVGYPELYESFVVERAGNRTFLLKQKA
jgi:predicted phage-related endonuclease